MKLNKKIEEEVKKTMDLLEEKGSVKPNPFFYTRVKARYDEIKNTSTAKESSYVQLVLKPAFLAVVISLNIVSGYFLLKDEEQSFNRDDFINALSEDYSISYSDSDIFNY
ncbi:MAG: hypothetical protein PVH88_16835 [Ignavibacteria bacterium]|jgi:hypothetical protein